MFSFVKSLFVGPASEAEGSPTIENSTPVCPQPESTDEETSFSDEKTDVNSNTPSTDRRAGDVSKISLVDKTKNTTKITYGGSSSRGFNGLADIQAEQHFEGSFYRVDGVHVECLMEKCECQLRDGMMNIKATPGTQYKGSNVISVKVASIRNFQQHLIDAFQFIVIGNKNEGALEYGIQMVSAAQAGRFSESIYRELIHAASTVLEIECALAEYDTKEREFVILSKSATGRILESTMNDYYLTLSHKASARDEEEYYFIDYLSKDIQIWSNPSSNQITFWGHHQLKWSMTKTMFLMEINPNSVGEASTNLFFKRLAFVLHDTSFLRTKIDHTEVCDSNEEDAVLQDDGFDVGHLSDNPYCLEWKNGRRSTAPRARASYFSAHSECSDSDDGDEVEELYTPYNPMYSHTSSDDTLIHRFMEVGTNRTFVCRGDVSDNGPFATSNKPGTTRLQLKVYRKEQEAEGDVLESVGVIDGRKFTYKGKTFVPMKGLLHQQEKKMLLIPENDNAPDVFMMDLETEKVVQHWDTTTSGICTMFPTFKKGQASLDPTFLCANPRELFLMDTRVPDGNAKTTAYSYATNPQLSVGATDSNGHILLGSRLGELRMFDGTANAKGDFKRAKTLLQTIKEPITAVDVNSDGTWILATTKTFLVVFPTRLANSTKTGFDVPLGKKKPAPRYLMLTAEDMLKYQITCIDFAPAKFDAAEDSIVTSTGNMAVVWDFESVRRGKPFYSVRFAEDSIKDVQIPMNSSDVVVAYPTAIGLFGTEKHPLRNM